MKAYVVFILCFSLGLCLISCEPSITVTKDYVTSSEWGKSANSKYIADCWIYKLIVPDSITLKVKNENFNLDGLGEFYELDSTYCYFKTYSESRKVDTLYFNKPNKFHRWNPCAKVGYETDYTVPILGEFEEEHLV